MIEGRGLEQIQAMSMMKSESESAGERRVFNGSDGDEVTPASGRKAKDKISDANSIKA